MSIAIDLTRELDAIRSEKNAQTKGRLLEELIARLFCMLPGITLDARDVLNSYHSEEIDLVFWNDQLERSLRFLDCPLIIECKGWSKPVSGREIRYFATELKDKARRNGIFIALTGITGDITDLSASFFHIAASMIDGVQVLVITGDELSSIRFADDIVSILRRKLLELTKLQIMQSKKT